MGQNFWKLIQEGDESAFALLYDKHANMLYGYGMKITANEDIVTEAIQTLFVYIYEKRRRLSMPVNPGSYLCVSLKRLILLKIKKAGKHDTLSIDDASPGDMRFVLDIDSEAAIIHDETQADMMRVLQRALDSLTNRQREIIYLKYYHGMNNQEIADVVGINYQVVKNTASQAIARLRENKNLSKLFMTTTASLIGMLYC